MTPLGGTVQGLLSSSGESPLLSQAERLPYASLLVETRALQGLVVLGAEAGETTIWPAGNAASLALYQDGLQATAGLPRDLLSLHYADAEAPGAALQQRSPWRWPEPPPYRVESRWQESDGSVHAAQASGELHCSAPAPLALPLGSRSLQACHETLYWSSGETTHATLWRDPQNLRLWAVELSPWPQGPSISWQVARPWW